MKSTKIKTVKGYTKLSQELARLGVSDHAMDEDVLKEVIIPQGYPITPYSYTGKTVAFWKGNDAFYSWPETKQLTYEIHKLKE